MTVHVLCWFRPEVPGQGRTAFFSGDISALAEEVLLPHLPPQVDFLLAPHHGSGSSSSMAFVRHLGTRTGDL
jgi:beta-lactamase superfamily II metal-dependent hydrolase